MKILLVGGAVRDSLMGRNMHDLDFVVVGATEEEFLMEYPDAVMTGKDFPVYRTSVGEYAMARRERKNGSGHTGFHSDLEDVTLEDDLLRRDFTVNAMAGDLDDPKIIDPFGGRQDIKNKVLRHVSPAFAEDPLRVFRGARFAATLGFTVHESTMELMRSLKDELPSLSAERVFTEMQKALKGINPRAFFDVLRDADALDYWFAPVKALIGVPQPKQWHPEGDVYEHTMIVMDRCKDDPMAAYAALCHDLGKGVTPKAHWPAHQGHDKLGVPLTQAMSDRLRVPIVYKKAALVVTAHHMKAKYIIKPGKYIRMAMATSGCWPVFQKVALADCMLEEKLPHAHKQMSRIISAQEVIKEIGGDVIQKQFPDATGPRFGELLLQERASALRHRW